MIRTALFFVLPCGCLLAACAASPIRPDVVVAADGSGNFRRVQEAINASPGVSGPTRPWTILVKAGAYRELVYVQREKRYLRLVGEGADKTVLGYGLYAAVAGHDGRPIGTFHTPSTQIDADDFTAEDVAFENSAGPRGQALAIRLDGDRTVFRRCRFAGWQDTILANRGRHYFAGCAIAGAVDFIFGGATAWFDHCRIECKGTGYIAAPSTPREQPYGFVFADCSIIGASEAARTYLGRPWRPYGSAIYLRAVMSSVVRPEGWNNWSQPDREKTARFAEYGGTGPGADPAARVAWARRLTAAEAAAITIPRVLGGTDGWAPSP